ncbi:MAG: hypothetical protein PHI79_04300 [Sulfurovaceae bacterium]|nr:hypothetical protein [Sulfurovaceae bacterium]MDD5548804.1 hypothetical protein [Sulfurovaceae bacterium]
MKNDDGFNDYDFDIGEVIRDAYELTNGVKLTFFLSFLFYVFVIMGVSFLVGLVYPGFAEDKISQAVLQLVISVLAIPMIVGIQMLALKHTRGEDIEFKDIFNYYNKTLKLFFASLLVAIFIYIPLILFAILAVVAKIPVIIILSIFPILYIALSYTYTTQLIADKDLKIWDAMELSRKAVKRHWLKFFGLGFMLGIIYLIGALALGIGLIWAIPLVMIAMSGIVYRKAFD